jgi:hypothetical protein
LHSLAALKANNRFGRDFRHRRELISAKPQSRTGHFALHGQHRETLTVPTQAYNLVFFSPGARVSSPGQRLAAGRSFRFPRLECIAAEYLF